MTTFSYYNNALEVNVKFRVLTIEQSQEFVANYEELPKHEYLFNVLNMCVLNIESEIKPALGSLDPEAADLVLINLYNGCVMLNPILDIVSWSEMLNNYNALEPQTRHVGTMELHAPPEMIPSFAFFEPPEEPVEPELKISEDFKPLVITKAKLNSLPKVLKGRVIGQNEPIDIVHRALRRHQVGLSDPNCPIGVYMFCGPSGVGKTLIAAELHRHLFGLEGPMVRIDCGEYQLKHENQKLVGSPPGYMGYEDGGFLFKAMQRGAGGVILLDEVEKAHRDFWDLFLKVWDEGLMTDSKGNVLDFRNSIFILTSNLGNEKISQEAFQRQAGFTSTNTSDRYGSRTPPKREMVERMTMEAVRKFFKPEVLNRIDETVIFNHLSDADFGHIADLEFQKIRKKLSIRQCDINWTNRASKLLAERSGTAMEGARSMERERRRSVEDPLAELLNNLKSTKGKVFNIDAVNGEFVIK